jgi:DeoR family transcriptional regulator of aga operon
MANELNTAERRRLLLALVRASDFARIPALSERFGVSKVTIRNDLAALAERGLVIRVHGGAIPSTASSERAFEARSPVAADEKLAIAEAAMAMLKSRDTLVLDVGTTTMAIAHALLEHTELTGLVVFTNALNIALALSPAIPRIEVMVTGGTLRPLQYSLVEPRATGLLKEIRAEYAFIGCDGIHPTRGITTTNLPEATMKQAMVKASHQRVVVADSSKFLREALTKVCDLGEIDIILTAGEFGPNVLAPFADAPVEIRVAPQFGAGGDGYRVGRAAPDYRVPKA